MTIFLRGLWGPFGPFDRHVGSLEHQVDWYFFGIREDNTMGRWALRFTAKTRSWTIVSFPMQEKPAAPAMVDAFVPEKPMVHGPNMTTILRKQLSGGDVARATAASLALKGRV